MIRLIVVLVFLATTAFAVEPSEVLSDPVLEQRAREISGQLRCPVCQNESIDESSAQLSADLRVILRERLVAGDTDAQAMDYLVSRYGEFILLAPDKRGVNVILWAAAPILLLLSLFVGWKAIRPRKAAPTALTADEQHRLDDLLKG